jgi:uncharacterized protein YecT (DUF1311 family)
MLDLSWPLVVVALAAVPPSVSESASKSTCWDTAQTQMALNQCAEADLKAADADLNAAYKQLMARPDEAFKQRLRAAQRAWVAFRDAHVAALYGGSTEGSVRPMCAALTLRDLTQERVKQLRALLEPEEGDTCAALQTE